MSLPSTQVRPDGHRRVLYNKCYGGFSFSKAFVKEFNRRHPEETINVYTDDYRDDQDAVALFNELGSKASSGKHAKLKSVLVPPGCKYRVSEYDGMETVYVMPDINKGKILDDLLQMLRPAMEPDTTVPDLSLDASISNSDVKLDASLPTLTGLKTEGLSALTRQLLQSNMTFKEFKAKLHSDMHAYQARYHVKDKP